MVAVHVSSPRYREVTLVAHQGGIAVGVEGGVGLGPPPRRRGRDPGPGGGLGLGHHVGVRGGGVRVGRSPRRGLYHRGHMNRCGHDLRRVHRGLFPDPPSQRIGIRNPTGPLLPGTAVAGEYLDLGTVRGQPAGHVQALTRVRVEQRPVRLRPPHLPRPTRTGEQLHQCPIGGTRPGHIQTLTRRGLPHRAIRLGLPHLLARTRYSPTTGSSSHPRSTQRCHPDTYPPTRCIRGRRPRHPRRTQRTPPTGCSTPRSYDPHPNPGKTTTSTPSAAHQPRRGWWSPSDIPATTTTTGN